MALDPQAGAYLEQVRALGAPAPWEVPLEQARRAYDGAAAALFGAPDEVASADDEQVEGVAVRIYRPTGDQPPALVYCHGGGWVLGSLDSHDPLCRTLAARSGAAVISVGYRLAPEHPYPAALDDAWTVTRWASQRHARLALAGDSAGGQLAAAVALCARDAGLAIALQALIYPATDYAFDTPSYGQATADGALGADAMRWFWSQYVPDPARAGEPGCSPLRAADLAALAPALVLTAEHDPLRDEGEAYAQRLAAAGVPVELHRYDGLIHGFIRMPAVISRAQQAIDAVARAVRAALAPAG